MTQQVQSAHTSIHHPGALRSMWHSEHPEVSLWDIPPPLASMPQHYLTFLWHLCAAWLTTPYAPLGGLAFSCKLISSCSPLSPSSKASKGSQESSLAPPFESINSPVLSLLYGPTLTSENDYQKTIALIMQTFVSKVMPLLSNMLSFFVLVTQSCPALCDPMDYSLPGSSVHGILQVKKLEWVAFPSPGDLPNPGLPHCEQILYSQSHQGGPIGCLGL